MHSAQSGGEALGQDFDAVDDEARAKLSHEVLEAFEVLSRAMLWAGDAMDASDEAEELDARLDKAQACILRVMQAKTLERKRGRGSAARHPT